MKKLKYRIDLPLTLFILWVAFLYGFNIWIDRNANTYYTTAAVWMHLNFGR